MDVSTLIGVIFGTVCIIISILLGGSLLTFIDIPSVFIVIGGTIASVMISFKLDELKSVIKVTQQAFGNKILTAESIIDQLVELAERARREGILAIEPLVSDIKDSYMRDGLRLVVDGMEAESIRAILENEISQMEGRHKTGQKVIHAAATYAPAFGMVGTLIGLINMLKTLDDPTKIGAGMAVALITTFYGAILANFLLLPLEGKLKMRTESEVATRELVLAGIMALQTGENPRLLRSRLQTFVAPANRKEVE